MNVESAIEKLQKITKEKEEHFRSFEVHNNMNVESAIEKLQKITKEKKVQRNEHRQR
jgi:hypothetical protein